MDMDNKLVYLNVEICLWGESINCWVQGMYVVVGVGYVDNQYDLIKCVGINVLVEVDGSCFNGGVNGVNIDGKLSYDN